MQNTLNNPATRTLSLIRTEWIVSCGAVIAVVLFALWISPWIMPFVEAVIATAIIAFNRSRQHDGIGPCGRVGRCVAAALYVTAAISETINILHHTGTIDRLFADVSFNRSIPFITSLIIFPVLTVASTIASSRVICTRHSRRCHLHNEYNPGQVHFGRAVHAMYRATLRYMSSTCLVLTVIDWLYYTFFYMNVSLNTPDRFFYVVIPVAVYIWSIFHVRENFTSVILPTGQSAISDVNHLILTGKNILRFLVICNDRLLLEVTPVTLSECRVDTPFVVDEPLSDDLTPEKAQARFRKLTGIAADNCTMRELYTVANPIQGTIIHHYLVNIVDSLCNDDRIPAIAGEWTTLDGVDRFLKMGVLSPQLNAEIYRIYTITMAWKTYDTNGLRRYPIRNYRPTFRLRDAINWDVDYNDTRWMRISRINQDSALWFIQRHFLH